MGLFGAMTASVSALSAQGQAISVVSDNLANTNTVGYKAGRSLFSQLVTSAGTSGSSYNAGGVSAAVQRDQTAQGSLISSSSLTDLAISGNGFFRVADSSVNTSDTSYFYTRAGDFAVNKAGFLINPSGFFLQGWKTDSDGTILNVQNPEAIELQSVGVSSQETSELGLNANLNSTTGISADYDTSGALADSLSTIVADPTLGDFLSDVRVFDAQGGARDMTIAFTKRSANQWDWQLYTDGSNVQGGATGVNSQVGSGMLQFNTTGSLEYATGTGVTINWAGGVNPSNITLNFGDYTGGKVVTATSAGLGFEDTTAPAVTASTVSATNTADSLDVSGAGMAAGTYHLVLTADNTLVISTDAAGTVGAVVTTTPAAGAVADAAQNITFANGAKIHTTAPFDANPGGYPVDLGTFTVGTTDAGNVLGIAVEDNTFAAGDYTIKKTSATTVGLYDSTGTTLLDTASIAASGTREVYFTTSKVRLTVSNGFDETNGVYPATVGTFTVSQVGALTNGVGTNGVIQFAANSNTSAVNQNGFGAGTLASVQVDENGYINGTFTNGETKKLYRIALGEFQNPSGLEPLSGNLLRVTDSSGQALLKQPNVGGTGRIVGGALEGSTTDIAGEFSQMIVAQRAFQASSTVITTVDQMLNQLLQLR
jgi:flagellar hook protein FlgE